MMAKTVFAGLALVGTLAFAEAASHVGKAGTLSATMAAYPGCTDDCVTGGTFSATFDGKTLDATYELKGIAGILPSLKASGFNKLSTYTGSHFHGIENNGAKGVVIEHDADGKIEFYYDFTMHEKNATGGIHIHAGASCDAPGAHYWDSKNKTVADPWNTNTMWKSDADGKAKFSFQVSDVYGFANNSGKVIVVHDSAGEKMACAVLEVAGAGFHVHSGTTCGDAAQVGGHYWDSKNGSVADPWTTTFLTDATTVSATAVVNDGYTHAEHDGHAVVIHSAAGTRIGCGLLAAPAAPVTAPAKVATAAANATGSANATAPANGSAVTTAAAAVSSTAAQNGEAGEAGEAGAAATTIDPFSSASHVAAGAAAVVAAVAAQVF